jgi:hypothetical protein
MEASSRMSMKSVLHKRIGNARVMLAMSARLEKKRRVGQESTAPDRPCDAVGILSVAMLLFSMLLVGCGVGPAAERTAPAERTTLAERPTTAERPESVAQVSVPPGYIFESLPRLVATSEVVVVGEVISAEKGERLVPDDILYHRDVTVHVERQLYGPPVEDTIVVHVGGYDGDASYELQDMPWLYPGDRAVYFLAHAPGDPPKHYELIAAPGRLAIEGDGTVSTEASDPIARRLDGQQWSVVAPRIRNAVQVVRQQDIEPLPPDPFGEGG